MNISKNTIVASLLSSLLMGCGGGGSNSNSGHSSTGSDRVLQYNFDNIVSEFLGADIDYKLTTGTPESTQDTERAYSKDRGRVESFSITPAMLASNTCPQQPEPLDLEKRSRFNISPVGSDGKRRVVNFTNFPKVYEPNFTDKCYYRDYNLSGRYIIGSSNEKLTDLSDNEDIVNPTDFISLADMNRLLSVTETVPDQSLSEYMNKTINKSDHEFIVNTDNGAVRVFDTELDQYVNLDGTKNIKWQFYGNDYLISSFSGGYVYVYDIKNKQLIGNASFKVVENFKATIKDLGDDEIVTSYGIFPNPNEGNVAGLPFKFVYNVVDDKDYVYVLKQGIWEEASDAEAGGLPTLTDLFKDLKDDVEQFDYDLTSDNFYATYGVGAGGFTVKTSTLAKLLKAGTVVDTKDLKVITGFPDTQSGIQMVNGNVVMTSKKDWSQNTFYMIKDYNRYRLGLNAENMKSIQASSHN
ncbi:hypothetical protein AKG98_1484 [Moritella sp. JT01]|uniref:hypothetical protein n=1 Tax=Moritella sp. JT01 TaxID=756698 RepID=UPI000797A857|nr:hypothetical protein [Moritella sp. JT01]KXO09266.1 hypothetical protein AKG98_1484 [Moritella sp. JT01]